MLMLLGASGSAQGSRKYVSLSPALQHNRAGCISFICLLAHIFFPLSFALYLMSMKSARLLPKLTHPVVLCSLT
jgi:hypothetical protein